MQARYAIGAWVVAVGADAQPAIAKLAAAATPRAAALRVKSFTISSCFELGADYAQRHQTTLRKIECGE